MFSIWDGAQPWTIYLASLALLASCRLVYMTFKADLKARMQCHRLEQYYRCKKCCDRCMAIQPMDSRPHPMTYKNTARDAPYASTCKDHDEYLQTARHQSPWCAVPGFQFETMSFDMMHLVYLGIAKNHIPSCLKILKLYGYHYEGGESDEKFLKRVSMEMKQDCKERKHLVASQGMFYNFYWCSLHAFGVLQFWNLLSFCKGSAWINKDLLAPQGFERYQLWFLWFWRLLWAGFQVQSCPHSGYGLVDCPQSATTYRKLWFLIWTYLWFFDQFFPVWTVTCNLPFQPPFAKSLRTTLSSSCWTSAATPWPKRRLWWMMLV